MVQQLSLFAGETVPLTFIPHLLPNIRGIFSTIYVRLKERGMGIDYQALYEKAYAEEPFVDVRRKVRSQRREWYAAPIWSVLRSTEKSLTSW